MTTDGTFLTGGELVVDALRTHGAEHVFCVPGESFLAVLDALHDAPDINVTVCRQEGGAAMMADAIGKLTGRPGICMVTRGPGATNASAGVHIAFQDSTPLILMIGQVARDVVEREGFQEIDYRRMYGQLAKWTAQIDDAARVPEFVSRAFATATQGRPGPVALALPEDMLVDRAPKPAYERCRPATAYPGSAEMDELAERMAGAKRPMVVVGGGGWSAQAKADLERFASEWRIPVGAAFRCQDYFDNGHDSYAGDVGIGPNPKLADRVAEADVLLVLGARMGEATSSNYTLLDIPRPRQHLIHIHADAEELGRVYQAALPINAAPAAAAAALAGLAAPKNRPWADGTEAARAAYLDWVQPTRSPGDLQMAEIVAWLRGRLDPGTVVTNGAGNFAIWVNRFYQYRKYRTQLAPTSGSMGYGTPAAVAAARFDPDRPVVAFAGDGCFLMHGQELATAAQYGLRLVVLVVNNGMYGTIRMHQEREYPGRVSGTQLTNPDFARLAEAYGGFGQVVTRTEEFAPAFEKAIAADTFSVIELRVDPEAITPRTTLSDIRAKALAARTGTA